MTCTSTGYDGYSFWDVASLLRPEVSAGPAKYSVIVLNRPITIPPEFLIPFWNKAIIRIAVDGGINRWYNYVDRNKAVFESCAKVDVICGDFDSVSTRNYDRAKENGAQIFHTPDQNETDFAKSLAILENLRISKNLNLESVFVVCETSGRVDQIMSNVHTLYMCATKLTLSFDVSVYLLAEDSLSWILRPGRHRICVPAEAKRSRECSWCGLIPVGEACDSVTTSGLKWNLKGDKLKFGEFISTSNTYDGADPVTVQNSSPLYWCMCIRSMFGNEEQHDD